MLWLAIALQQSYTHGMRTVVKKMPLRDMEGDDDELEDSDFHDCWKTYKASTLERCIVILCPCANLPRCLFEGGVYFTQCLQLCGIHSRAASIHGNTVGSGLLRPPGA